MGRLLQEVDLLLGGLVAVVEDDDDFGFGLGHGLPVDLGPALVETGEDVPSARRPDDVVGRHLVARGEGLVGTGVVEEHGHRVTLRRFGPHLRHAFLQACHDLRGLLLDPEDPAQPFEVRVESVEGPHPLGVARVVEAALGVHEALDAELVEDLGRDAPLVLEARVPAGHDEVGLGLDHHLLVEEVVAEHLHPGVLGGPRGLAHRRIGGRHDIAVHMVGQAEGEELVGAAALVGDGPLGHRVLHRLAAALDGDLAGLLAVRLDLGAAPAEHQDRRQGGSQSGGPADRGGVSGSAHVDQPFNGWGRASTTAGDRRSAGARRRWPGRRRRPRRAAS